MLYISVSQTALSHYPACTNTGPRPSHPCSCSTQTCIDDAIHTYNTGKYQVNEKIRSKIFKNSNKSELKLQVLIIV